MLVDRPADRDGPALPELLVDLSVIAMHDAGTGIQRVVRAVHAQIGQLIAPSWLIRPVAASATCNYRYLPDSFPGEPLGVPLEDCPVVNPTPGSVFLGLDLTSAIMPRHETQIAGWREAGVQVHIWVYDLLPLLHGEWFRRRTRKHFRRWLGVIERRADQVICNADEVRRQFERWNGRWWRSRGRRRVAARTIALSGDISSSKPSCGIPADAEEILAWMGMRPTVLMVGTVEPRKGHDQALAAFALLWREMGMCAPALLVVGRPGWKTARIQKRMRALSSFEGPFLWRDDISDEFLEVLYARASAMLFASRGEGFGLPVVEMQRHGRPMIVRKLPELSNIHSPSAVTFSGNSARVLAEAIRGWLTKPNADRSPIEMPEGRTWREVAIELLDAVGVASKIDEQEIGVGVRLTDFTDGDA